MLMHEDDYQLLLENTIHHWRQTAERLTRPESFENIRGLVLAWIDVALHERRIDPSEARRLRQDVQSWQPPSPPPHQ